MTPLVNVLTRTSNRPLFFRDNYRSVKEQSYPAIRHVVCADNENSYRYAAEHVNKVIRVTPPPPHQGYGQWPAPYNLYCNALMAEVAEGWIMFLDDDDCFTSPFSIPRIVSAIRSERDLVLWKVQFPGGPVPQRCFGRFPELGDISAIGFMFHSNHRWAAAWAEVKESDYRVIQKLYRLLEPRWIDEVLTRVNYKEAVHGGSGGFGFAKDKGE